MPAEDVYGLSPGARVVAYETRNHASPKIGKPPSPPRRTIDRAKLMPVGESLLGRVLDGPAGLSTTTARCIPTPCGRCRADRQPDVPGADYTGAGRRQFAPSTPC
jgi:flagellar biosynthesis/type III secretory pathway ATPase